MFRKLTAALRDAFSSQTESEPATEQPVILQKRNAGIFGDAGWATWQELAGLEPDVHMADVFQVGGIVSDGVYLGRAIHWEKPIGEQATNTNYVVSYRGENNIVTIAPSGRGKGTCAIIPTLLTSQESAFVLDVKGTNFIVTAAIRQHFGQRIIMLNPFNIWGKELGFKDVLSVRFNPLHNLKPDNPDFVSNINGLASAIIVAEGKEPHWTSRARELVACLMAHVCSDPFELANGGNTLPRVRQILSYSPDRLSEYLINAMANPVPLVRNNAGSFSGGTNEIKSIISTALGQLAFLNDPAIARFLSASDFDFQDMRKEPMTVYCMIPPREIDTYYRFVRLMVQSLFDSLATIPRPNDRRVLVALDEQAKLRHMEILETSAALLREYRVRIWSIFQDLNQLKGIYGESWETFLSNAGAVQFYTPNDHTTAKYISDRIGDCTVSVKSESVSQNYDIVFVDEKPLTKGTSVGTNVSQQGVRFLTMQGALGLADDTGIVFFNGLSYPAVLWKNPYYRDNWFKPGNKVGGHFFPNPYKQPELLAYDPATQDFDWQSCFVELIKRIKYTARPIVFLTPEQLRDETYIPRLAREYGIELPSPVVDQATWEQELQARIREALNMSSH